MTDFADDLRRLIAQNHEMERRLRELQLAIAGMRAEFETVIASRIQELDSGVMAADGRTAVEV